MDKLAVLRQYFGFPAFRAGQQTLIDAVLSGRDALGVMPTGGGKSLCYELPALLLPGMTLVVSPLISLMKDQVMALRNAGIPAGCINSSMSLDELRETYRDARYGAYKLLYVAPERLLTDGFCSLAQELEIPLVAVDEAHCISQWGYDFRPSYLRIAELREKLPGVPVLALTASATKTVADDIMRHLKFPEPHILRSSFARPNLSYSVRRTDDKNGQLLRLVRNVPGTGIVYVRTREGTEQIADLLRQEGTTAAAYHGGLGHAERSLRQEEWLSGKTRVMVATNAFGMGIDKADVRFVIHYNMPRDLESYYQEAGRAGRDGDPADCLLLYSGQDVITARWMIEHSDDNPELDADERAELQRRDLERLKQMTFYATSKRCLRAFLLRYFGEEAPDDCGSCSVCEELPFEVDTGRGRLDGVPAKEARQERKRRQESLPFTGWEAAQYENLRTLRALLAAHFHLPVYMIFSDASLRDTVQKRPKTEDEFLEVSGVGQAKLERYGSYFLAVLRDGKEPNSLLQGG